MIESRSYVAICRGCGHVVAAISDSGDNPKRLAKEVGLWLSDNLIVERWTDDQVREAGWTCACRGAQAALPGFERR